MKDQPLVTIITPTYNHEQYIGPCVESILAQTYPHWEMLIIDDGSSDGTSGVLERYRDPRIQVLRQQNKGIAGLSETYRSALARAGGDLVTILSGDDAWPAHRLEKQVPVFADASVSACFGRGVVVDGPGRPISEVPGRKLPFVLNRPVGSILGELLAFRFLPSYTYLIARWALEEIGGFQQLPGILGVDSPTIFKLALVGEFRYLDLPMGYWRVHAAQNTGTHRLEQARTDDAYSLQFFRSLSPDIQKLTGWTEERLMASLARQALNIHFEVGRRQLLVGNRREALRQFFIALREGPPSTKLKALLGSACAVSRVDLERVVRLARRPALR